MSDIIIISEDSEEEFEDVFEPTGPSRRPSAATAEFIDEKSGEMKRNSLNELVRLLSLEEEEMNTLSAESDSLTKVHQLELDPEQIIKAREILLEFYPEFLGILSAYKEDTWSKAIHKIWSTLATSAMQELVFLGEERPIGSDDGEAAGIKTRRQRKGKRAAEPQTPDQFWSDGVDIDYIHKKRKYSNETCNGEVDIIMHCFKRDCGRSEFRVQPEEALEVRQEFLGIYPRVKAIIDVDEDGAMTESLRKLWRWPKSVADLNGVLEFRCRAAVFWLLYLLKVQISKDPTDFRRPAMPYKSFVSASLLLLDGEQLPADVGGLIGPSSHHFHFVTPAMQKAGIFGEVRRGS